MFLDKPLTDKYKELKYFLQWAFWEPLIPSIQEVSKEIKNSYLRTLQNNLTLLWNNVCKR